MATYQFPNKYNKTTYFTFNETGMTIKELWLGDQEREYSFMYSDISRYSIIPTREGLYKIVFWSDNKKIQLSQNNNTSLVSYISIQAGKVTLTSTTKNTVSIDENDDDLLKIIHDNSPLRSELDELKDRASSITTEYEKATEEEMGMIYIKGPVKDYTSYQIKVNDTPYFTLYTTKQEKKLKENGQWVESNAQPQWIDNRTIAFKIPFGEWDITYSFSYSVTPPDRFMEMKETAEPDKVHIIVDKNHPVVRIKKKNKLLGSKLVEI